MLTWEFESAIIEASASTRMTANLSGCFCLLLSSVPMSDANAEAADVAMSAIAINIIAARVLFVFCSNEVTIVRLPNMIAQAKTDYFIDSWYDTNRVSLHLNSI